MIATQIDSMYSEVYGILNMLGPTYISKIPMKLYNLIESKKNEKYCPKYQRNIPLEKQNVSIDSITFIAILHYNYWCKDIEEKIRLDKLFKDNENEYQNQLIKQFDPDVFGKKREKNKKQIKEETQKNLLVCKKENIITKIVNKIKSVFNIK